MSIGTLLRKAQRSVPILQKRLGKAGGVMVKAADFGSTVLDAADKYSGGLDNLVPGVPQARTALAAARAVGRAAQGVGGATSIDGAVGSLRTAASEYQASQPNGTTRPIPGAISTDNPLLSM